jgi:ribosome biogenesis GTPase A
MANKLGKAKKGRGKSENTNKHKKSVYSIIDNIIEEADIILEILDSRFIEKTRNPVIENQIKKLGKTLIYVFNKSDLVNVNEMKLNVELEKLKPNLFLSSKKRHGSVDLKKLIKMEAKKLNQDSVNIGIVGYPNTGKSSLTNYLTGKSSAKTSPEAGYTKGIQKIKLSTGLYLIDTPGIIPLLEKSSKDKKNLVKHSHIGAITWDKTKSPDLVIDRLMKEYKGVLEKHYKIEAKGDSEILIEELGKKLHYLKKGNLIDETRVSKQILKDWQEGKTT